MTYIRIWDMCTCMFLLWVNTECCRDLPKVLSWKENSNYIICRFFIFPACQVKHIIKRLTCWLWDDCWGFCGWLCMGRGGGVGTEGAGVRFWDWDVAGFLFKLLSCPCSFLKLLTACGGRKMDGEQSECWILNLLVWRYRSTIQHQLYLEKESIITNI